MGIFEAVNARRDAWIAQRQASIEEARRVWVGMVVSFYDSTLSVMYPWLPVNADGLIYGQVREIDDRGGALIVYGYTSEGESMWRLVPFTVLGVNYWLVEG